MYVEANKDQSEKSQEKHQHVWHVVSDHWKCEDCGKTFGLNK